MALACFRSIRDLLPAHIADVNNLSSHVLTKRDEFTQEYHKRQTLRRKRTRSRESRTGREDAITAPTSFTGQYSKERWRHSLTPQDPQTPPSSQLPMYHPQSLSISTPDSSLDGASRQSAEGHDSVRSTKNRIVTYDGHTQQVLERLVKDIWSAKSKLRTARITDSTRWTGHRQNTTPVLVEKSCRELLSSRRTNFPAFDEKSEKERAKNTRIFDFVENQLEIVQNVCESAAHQFLRQGDCTHELDVILGIFDLILEASTNATQRLEAEEEARRLEEQKAEDESQRQFEAVTAMPPITCADDPDVIVKPLSKADDNILEVDDDDASSISIDITVFRLTRHGNRPCLPSSARLCQASKEFSFSS